MNTTSFPDLVSSFEDETLPDGVVLELTLLVTTFGDVVVTGFRVTKGILLGIVEFVGVGLGCCTVVVDDVVGDVVGDVVDDVVDDVVGDVVDDVVGDGFVLLTVTNFFIDRDSNLGPMTWSFSLTGSFAGTLKKKKQK